jgi:transposase
VPYEEQALRPAIQAAFDQGGVDAICRLVVVLLNEQEARYQAVIVKLEARIAELEKRLSKNSTNSSKPPSSDGLKRTLSLRPRNSGRKPGGQPGHPGHTLGQVPEPHQIVELPLPQCPQCAASLAEVAAASTERRQVFDLPPRRIEVTEYRSPCKLCPVCGGVHSAPFPAIASAATQYGPSFNAVMAHLHGTHLLPYARVAELCGELYGHRPSAAAVVASMVQAADHMAPTVAAIGEALTRQAVAHADETGVRCEGKTRWVHVCSNAWLTHLSFGGQRGAQGFGVAGILERMVGVLVHDFWVAYFVLECLHSYCNAHLLRELKAMRELNGHAWAGQLSAVLMEMKAAVEEAVKIGQQVVPAIQHKQLHERYDTLLVAAQQAHPEVKERKPGQTRGRIKQSAEYSLLARLDEHRDEVLRFFDQPGMPFDNNQAERDLRMLKVQQKTSGCFRTKSGATLFCTFRSYVCTAKKLGLNLLDEITAAFAGAPFTVPLQLPE